MFSSGSSSGKRRVRDDQSTTSSQAGSAKKKHVGEAKYSATHAPPPPSGPPPEQSSEERILTPDDEDDSDDVNSVLFDIPRRPSIVSTRSAPTQRSSTPTMSSSSSKAKVNPPAEFHGKPGTLKTFLSQSKVYFFLNPKEFDTDDKKTTFMISYMRGPAYKTFESRLMEYISDPAGCKSEIRHLFTRLRTFENELKLTYDNVDEKRAADRELHAIRQKTSVGDYAADFQRIQASLNWDDNALMSQFFAGLKWEVKNAMLLKDTKPESLHDMIRVATQVDSVLYESYLERKGRGFTRTYGKQGNNKSNQGKPRRSENYYGPMPMEVDKLQRRDGKKGDKRSSPSKGKCYNCGKEGHYANKCRQPKKDNQQRSTATVRKLEVKQICMLARKRTYPPGFRPGSGWIWGPNQVSQNPAAVRRILKEAPETVLHHERESHRILPMSECRDGDCDLWEHNKELDVGESDWDLDYTHPIIHPTVRRQIIKSLTIARMVGHRDHQFIPRNLCEGAVCKLHGVNLFKSAALNLTDKVKPADTTWDELARKYPSRDGQAERKTISWSKKPNMDSTVVHHRDLPCKQCDQFLCDYHCEVPGNKLCCEILPTEHIARQEKDGWLGDELEARYDADMQHQAQPADTCRRETCVTHDKYPEREPVEAVYSELEHQMLAPLNCERQVCAWHDKGLPQESRQRILSTIRRNFTPDESEGSDTEDDDDYIVRLQTDILDLVETIDHVRQHRIDMEVPHDDFKIYAKVSVDPDKKEPKERLSFALKVYAKERIEDEEQDEDSEESDSEDDADSESSETLHGTNSGNGSGTWW